LPRIWVLVRATIVTVKGVAVPVDYGNDKRDCGRKEGRKVGSIWRYPSQRKGRLVWGYMLAKVSGRRTRYAGVKGVYKKVVPWMQKSRLGNQKLQPGPCAENSKHMPANVELGGRLDKLEHNGLVSA